MMSWSTCVSARCCPTETASSARLSETEANWWWGSTGKFLGRSTCRNGYISATRVGGYCHGDHCHWRPLISSSIIRFTISSRLMKEKNFLDSFPQLVVVKIEGLELPSSFPQFINCYQNLLYENSNSLKFRGLHFTLFCEKPLEKNSHF